MKLAIAIHACVVIFIVNTLAEESEQYKCGPDNKCSCYEDQWTQHNITMDCSGKQLCHLSEICKYLGNATRLDASNNNITGIFNISGIESCNNLEYLSLSNNQVCEIHGPALKEFSKLTTLDLSHNKLPIYTTNSTLDFNSLVNLECLKINGNMMKHINITVYPNLAGIKDLTSMYIDGVQSGNWSFPSLTKLKVLVVSGLDGSCILEKLSDKVFMNLPQLETLDLSFCKLAEISMNAFSSLSHLKRLDLSGNRRLGFKPLYNISYSLQFTNIDFLNYSYVHSTFGLGTELTKQDVCFLRNTTLRELSIDGNRIELLETNGIQLFPPTFQIFHINDNCITFGPYLLQVPCAPNLTDLFVGFQNNFHNPYKYLDEPNISPQTPTYFGQCPFMDDSFLQNISDFILNCHFYKKGEAIHIYPAFPKNLRKFILNDSFMRYKVPKFPIALKNNIEYLDLSGNELYDWEGPVGPVPNLKYLDVSRNYCTHIGSRAFEYMTNLQNLQIHSNFIGLSSLTSDKHGVFQNLISLKTMNLSLNKITSLHPKSFEGLYNLETLDLSFNSIDSWTMEVKIMKNLSHVNLSNNALQYLPLSLMGHLLDVSRRRRTNFTIDLRKNVLRYGCKNKDFLVWMIKHRNAFVGFNEYVFVDDDEEPVATNTIVTKVKELEKKCQSFVLWIVISSIGVSVALSVIIFGLMYRNRWKLRYLMYMTKQRFYGYVRIPNEAPIENYKYDAFISYAEENILFVKDMIIPNIEHNGISLCIHQRDFLPGNAIADNIVDAIQSSRKTVVLLSKAFLKRKWCMYEFNMARMESIYSRDGRCCLVLVMLEDVPATDMPPELIDWIRKESYLEYSIDQDGENLFWNSLSEAIRR